MIFWWNTRRNPQIDYPAQSDVRRDVVYGDGQFTGTLDVIQHYTFLNAAELSAPQQSAVLEQGDET